MNPIHVIAEQTLWEKLQRHMDEARADGFGNADLSDRDLNGLIGLFHPYHAGDFDGDEEYDQHLEQAFSRMAAMACAQALGCGEEGDAERLWHDWAQWYAERDTADAAGVEAFITHSVMMGKSEFILPFIRDFVVIASSNSFSRSREDVMHDVTSNVVSAVLSNHSIAIGETQKGPLLHQLIDDLHQHGAIDDAERSQMACDVMRECINYGYFRPFDILAHQQEIDSTQLGQVLGDLVDSHGREIQSHPEGTHLPQDGAWRVLIDKYELSLEKTIDIFPFHLLGHDFYAQDPEDPSFELKDLLYADKDYHAEHQLNKWRRERYQMKKILHSSCLGRAMPLLLQQFPDDLAPPRLQMFLEEEQEAFDPQRYPMLWARAQARVLHDLTAGQGQESKPKTLKM